MRLSSSKRSGAPLWRNPLPLRRGESILESAGETAVGERAFAEVRRKVRNRFTAGGIAALRRSRADSYDPAMLGNLLKNAIAACPASATGEGVPSRPGQWRAERFDAALADWRAGRTAEAVSACKALLEVAPDHLLAHSLLAAIALPGAHYLRILERIHLHLKPRTYLEIGVAAGASIRLARPETQAIGVDPIPQIESEVGPNVRIFPQTSIDFFAQHDVRAELGGLPIDLAFIDGMHHFEFALRDFMNVEALCAPGSTILIHDGYPLDERTAARERVTAFWSGDVWRLVLILRKHRPDLAVHTIATKPTGLTLVRNLDPRSCYIREHLDALVQEYLAVDFGILGAAKAEHLALLPNDWPQISALLGEPAQETAR